MYDSCKVAMATLCCFFLIVLGGLLFCRYVVGQKRNVLLAMVEQVKDERIGNGKCWCLWGEYLYWSLANTAMTIPVPSTSFYFFIITIIFAKAMPLVSCISSIAGGDRI